MDKQIHRSPLKSSCFDHLKNKTKDEIINDLGLEGNIYAYSFWYYVLETDWVGRRVILVLHFDYKRVTGVKIIRTWSRKPPRV